jgi:transglutaminase-like putative cysteine protease
MIRVLDKIDPAHLWLLLGLVLVFIPHVQYQQMSLVLVWIALLTWRFMFDMALVKLPSQRVMHILAIVTLVLIGVLHHTIFGRDASVALLITMLGLKLLEMKTWRDIAFVIFLGYFVVITTFLFTQSLLIGAYMAIVLFVFTIALISFNLCPNSKVNSRHTIAHAGRMLLQAIPFAVLLFILFPRLPGPLWGLPDDAFSGKSGLSDSMTPGNISHLSNNNAVAFRAQFQSTVPNAETLYWRGPVFSLFDGKSWRAPLFAEQKYYLSGAKLFINNQFSIVPNTAPLIYTVTLEPHNRNWLFALDLASNVDQPAYLSPDYELISRQKITSPIQYRAESTTQYKFQADRWSVDFRYLQLPQNIAPLAHQLVNNMRAKIDQRKPYDQQMAKLLLQYFKDNPFIYTLDPPRLLDDPVDDFLFNTQRGFCEHFSSAYAVLMRMAGIPARIVTGYQGGEINHLGDYVIVRQSDAHAWTEIWLKGQGWVRTDPTAIIPSERVEQTQLQDRFSGSLEQLGMEKLWLTKAWRNIRFALDTLNHRWNIWIIGYNSFTQLKFLDWLGLGMISWNWMVIILFVLLFIVFIPLAYYLLTIKNKPSDPVIKIYNKFCRRLMSIGITREPGEAAISLATKIKSKRPDLTQDVQVITQLYNDLRYAKHSNSVSLSSFKEKVSAFNP